MATELLRVNGISAGTEEKSILHSIDLSIGDGQAHVLMGPNGAGKSTLGRVIMGDPTYKITDGSVIFNGEDVTELAADKRSLAGIFLSYQAPVEVPGVPLYSFLRTITQMRPELKMTARQFRQRVGQISDQLELDQGFLMRELNVGFCCFSLNLPFSTRPTPAWTLTHFPLFQRVFRLIARPVMARCSSLLTTPAFLSALRLTALTLWSRVTW